MERGREEEEEASRGTEDDDWMDACTGDEMDEEDFERAESEGEGEGEGGVEGGEREFHQQQMQMGDRMEEEGEGGSGDTFVEERGEREEEGQDRREGIRVPLLEGAERVVAYEECDSVSLEGPSWVRIVKTSKGEMTAFSCLCVGCEWMTMEETEVDAHVKEHVYTEYARLVSLSDAGEGEEEGEGEEGPSALSFIPCPLPYCNRAISVNSLGWMLNHVSMHVFHASLQWKSMERLRKKEDGMLRIKSCGHKTRLDIPYNGEAHACLWENCQGVFQDCRQFFSHSLSHVEYVDKDDVVCGWDGCGKRFKNKSTLKAHMCHHAGIKSDACPFCGEFFSAFTKLMEHLGRRMEDEGATGPLLCKLCRKSFPNEKSLRAHCQRHVTKVKCEECGVCFATKYDLNRHQLTVHSHIIPQLVCPSLGCNKAFSTNTKLMQHQRLHSSSDLACPHCGRVFRWLKQLTKHVQQMHEDGPLPQYVCHVCDRRYEEGSSLSRHLKRSHHMATPPGFSRFQYKKCVDGLMRLQTHRPHKAEEA